IFKTRHSPASPPFPYTTLFRSIGMIRVVLAEDQTMVLSAFASLLDLEEDIRVVATATDGRQALEAVREHKPDVLLTDIEMPEMSGLDLAREVAAEALPTRVLILTTFTLASYLMRARDTCVAGYVLKDSPIADLGAALRQIHAGGRVISPELAVAAWGEVDPLTDLERDVLRLVGDGLPNREI